MTRRSGYRILAGIAALILAASLYLALQAAGFRIAQRQPPQSTGPASPTPTRQAHTTDPETPDIHPSPTSATSYIPEEVARKMDAIEAQVTALRGLQATRDVGRVLLSPDMLEKRVLDDFLKDYTEAEAERDALALSALGLLKPGYDLLPLYRDLLTEQVAGFYDHEADVMYVVQNEDFEGPERLTYAHEYVHAVQDQSFDFENYLNYTDESCDDDTDRCAAIQSLIEGDASLVELQWFREYTTFTDQRQIRRYAQTYLQPTYDSAPPFLKQDFVFPYIQGLEYVEFLYAQDGWQAVNQAYQVPPVSTQQILHPERYPWDKPVQVDLADLSQGLGPPWERVDHGTLGEWYTYLVLAHGFLASARLDETTAQAASAGWDGDAYAVYHDPVSGSTALILVTLWEDASQAAEFAAAFEIYATTRFGVEPQQEGGTTTWPSPDQHVEMHVTGSRTTWVLAPDSGKAGILNTLGSGD